MQPLLKEFSAMCEKSRTIDGDRQGDGWGMSWQYRENSRTDTIWRDFKSLVPIWQDTANFSLVPDANIFVAHARSASYERHKGKIEYNQPYIANSACFVFNGNVHGVKVTIPLDGEIGAQKIFSLLQIELKNNGPETALKNMYDLITKNSIRIEGMNIGLVIGGMFYVVSDYFENADYFSLHLYKDSDLLIVCSQPIGAYKWEKIPTKRVLKFDL